MSRYRPRGCEDPKDSGFNYKRAADEVWDAFLTAGVFVEGEFTFASGLRATLKADAEQLYKHPKQLERVMGLFATYPCVISSDVLLYVPNGMKEFMLELGRKLDKPVVSAIRDKKSASRYAFLFNSEEDRDLAINAESPLIGEDIVTTLGSVAGLRSLLPAEQDVHSLAILLRGHVEEIYLNGLTDHYLLTREIPTDKAEFHRQLSS